MRRLEELDSLRGLAAITVMLHHYLLIFPAMYESTFNQDFFALNLIKHTPLHILFAGHEAVILFFVLSGFVLSLPYYNTDRPNPIYSNFMIKRVCRIYIPYIVSVVIATILMFNLTKGGINEFSEWFNKIWELPMDWNALFMHFTLIGDFNNGEFNPIYWSLVHEMRISIIFPIIMLFIVKFNWKSVLIVSTIISAMGFAGNYLVKGSVDYFTTILYSLMFVVGALLAKHRAVLINSFTKMSKKKKTIVVIAAVFAYTFKWWSEYLPIGPLRNGFSFEIATTVGTSIFIILALSSRTISKILLFKPIHYIGEISYSVYLYHCIILFSMIYIFYGVMNIWLILALCIPITFVISSLAYRLVEVPSINIGRKLTNKGFINSSKKLDKAV